MLRSLLLIPILLCTAAAPAPTPSPCPAPMPSNGYGFQIDDICYATMLGTEVLVVHSDMKSATLFELTDIEIVQPVQINSFGYPSVTVPTNFLGNPNVIQSTYESATAKHTVITPCKGYSDAMCAAKHKAQLEALQKIFPKKS